MTKLHPQCAEFLKLGEEAPDISENDAHFARVNSHEVVNWGGYRETTTTIEHRYFTGPTADLPISIFRPEGSGPFNGMVYFHGGGWVVNYIQMHEAQLTDMAMRTNSIIVAVNYQKAPEHKFPIPFDDCYAAWEWTLAHAQELGIGTGKIGIGGDSAGANLASAVALKIRDVGKELLAYQWLIYPCNGVDFETNSYRKNAEGFGLSRRGMIWLWKQYLRDDNDKKNPYAVPLSAENFAGLAPAIIITAGFDVLHDDGEMYKDRLIGAGVQVAYKEYPDMIHGFYSLGKFINQGLAVRNFFAEEINRVLK